MRLDLPTIKVQVGGQRLDLGVHLMFPTREEGIRAGPAGCPTSTAVYCLSAFSPLRERGGVPLGPCYTP